MSAYSHFLQDWLYDEGDDTTKAVYVAKIDEIRSMAGPIVQRHFDKVEGERIAEQERLAAKRQAEEEARKAAEAEKAANAKDEEMTDAEAPRPEGEDGEAAK